MIRKSLKVFASMFICMSMAIASVSVQAANAATFAKGADIGLVNQLENNGITWQDVNGTAGDPLQILKNNGINSVRLRVFVNPPSNFLFTNNGYTSMLGYGDTNGVVYMAKRAKSLGMKVMIDFHYSDHFADPGRQDMPSAWVGHSFDQLKSDVYYHTYYTMKALKDAGITPEWVQIGNETNSGMMWPEGHSYNFSKWATLINEGYYGVKDASSSSKIIIHLANGANNDLYRYVFDGLTSAGAKFDIIGMSYYPHWDGVDYTQSIDALAYNMNDMASRYNKDIMICEVGGIEDAVDNTYNLVKKTIEKTKAVPNGRGLGVFYWEPCANSSVLPDGYKLGACQKVSNNVLRFTKAITAFK